MMSLRKLSRCVVSRTGTFKQVHGTFSPSIATHRAMKSPSLPMVPHRRFTNYASRSLESLNPDHVIFGIIGVNGIVWFMWKTADTREKQKFMIQNFTTSIGHLMQGRLWTPLTAAFSHMDGGHFCVNMLGVYFFGREVCAVLGTKRFLGLYLGSAVVASVCQIASGFTSNRHSLSLGASGAVNAITAFSICLYPRSTILIMMIIPMPAYVAGGLFILRDVWGAMSQSSSNIGHIAHLAGAGVGMLYYRHLFGRGRGGRRFF
ncbi:hypothetical protein Ae201684P_008231 [Aphanomyces euteiches]|uniref:Peptidase S54 rhomboid domain-containing protein n=1 Tax=Aphanomyces euteiches TaxID=100861 RepID=A0A6G0XPZ6_9STRA|nr:hypothetical protein Ae201684_002749 [Aphanomyces euteiches]KAH9092557.1 hypothetical protein Ae201684P_008231 [Aphanomyces euteiches]KAH9149392.1 hypothetical protein AeRB84_007531 [Aphanomyces euteiches]